MAKYFKIKIGSIWLTDDGTESGAECKIVVPGADALLSPASGNTSVASDGTPFTELPLTSGKGRAFEIQIAQMLSDKFDDLKTLIDALVAADDEINITATGTAGAFDVDAIPHFNPLPVSFERFTNSFIKNITLRFITTAIN